jgi:hypothetical protein
VTDEECVRCNALSARIDALQALLNEREDRTKERFSSMDRNVTAALIAADKAVEKAEKATEKRFEGVNEFRETLRDQAANLMPRAEYDVRHTALSELVTSIGDRLLAMESKTAGFTVASAQNRASNVDNSARLLSIISIVMITVIGISEIIVRLVH